MPTAARVPDVGRLASDVRRAVLRRRRPLAALFAAVAVVAALSAAGERPPPSVGVAVAAHDLPAGAVLTADDLVVVDFAPGSAPDRLAEDAEGRVLAAPVTRGEPVTEVRLVGQAMTEGRPDLQALPVRLPDAGAVALLRVGDVVDLVSADPQAGTAATVATSATVLAIPAADDVTGPTGLPGRLVVLGVRPGDVPDVADAVSRSVVTYAWSGR